MLLVTRPRSGLTLVEVIAVLCVCATSMLLISRALSDAREEARLRTCQQRLWRIAQATDEFHLARHRLPPGTLGFASAVRFDDWSMPTSPHYWQNSQWTSALALLLPYRGLGDLYDQYPAIGYDLDRNLAESEEGRRYGWFGQIPNSSTMAWSRLPDFVCPSDNINAIDAQVVGGSQPGRLGGEEHTDVMLVVHWVDRDYGSNFGRTNYGSCTAAYSGGVHPDPERMKYKGSMSSREAIRYGDILDGRSNTILFGETIGGIEDGNRTQVNSWFWGGLLRGRGVAPWLQAPGEGESVLGDARRASVVGFGSMHPAGVNVAMADGRVIAIRRDVDWQVWYAMCGKADEQTFELPRVIAVGETDGELLQMVPPPARDGT